MNGTLILTDEKGTTEYKLSQVAYPVFVKYGKHPEIDLSTFRMTTQIIDFDGNKTDIVLYEYKSIFFNGKYFSYEKIAK